MDSQKSLPAIARLTTAVATTTVASREQDAWLLRRQLAENASNVSGAAVGNLVNCAISCVLFSGTIPAPLIVLFVALLSALIGWRVMIARRIAKTRRNFALLGRLERELVANAIALGGLWGSAVAAMFIWGESQQAVFGGIIGAGMMSAGAISYRSIQAAAKGYVFAFTPGGMMGLLSIGTFASYSALGLLMCFIGVLVLNIRENANSFITICLRERDLKNSRNTIRLLLHDHTEQGADWLVAMDRTGRIVNPSARFASAAQRPMETLDGVRFSDLLDDDAAKAAWIDFVRNGNPVRNHIVSLTIGPERRWWSISGRAVREGKTVYRGVITDITAQRQAEEKVSYMAHYDGLTDLPNRFMFNEHLYHALRRDERAALLFMDLDHFKAVNDTLGHGVGDRLLQAAARRIEVSIDKRAMLARLGGDEFAILLTGAAIKNVDTVAQRVIQAMGRTFSLGDHDVVVGATIGIASAPDHGDCPETLLRNADLALYAAKARGRNRAIHYEAGMDEAAQERRLLEMDLRGALAKNEMRLHYQPLVDIHTGIASGHEALIRWEHPTRGIVMPNSFIPIAEDTGLIVQLGEWVIRQALDDLSGREPHLTVSVNLSPAQMRSPSLISTIVSGLAHSGVAASRLCLEITETVLMQDSETNIETLYKLREIGVQIALDDFGTGYSSLNYLRSFPFSKIKIDRCFVDEIDTREDCRAIIRSVVSLANSLGMTTTAEGVERPEQVVRLLAEGCGEVQGFLYSKAVPSDQLSNLRSTRPSGGMALPFPVSRDRREAIDAVSNDKAIISKAAKG